MVLLLHYIRQFSSPKRDKFSVNSFLNLFFCIIPFSTCFFNPKRKNSGQKNPGAVIIPACQPFSLLPNTSPMFTPSPSSASRPAHACRCSPWSCSPCGLRSSSRSAGAKSDGCDFRRFDVYALCAIDYLGLRFAIMFIPVPVYFSTLRVWIGFGLW